MNRSRRWLILLAGLVAIAVAAVIALPDLRAIVEVSLAAARSPHKFKDAPLEAADEMTFPLILRPDQAPLTDDEAVIGVSAGGRHRAYRLAGMGAIRTHVVNDMLGGVPVTPTFCGLRNCIRVYTSDQKGKPLAIEPGGFEEQMYLWKDGQRFWQETGKYVGKEEMPDEAFGTHPFDKTTWGEWRKAHPDTDVYVGRVRLWRW